MYRGLLALLSLLAPAYADPNALWRIVHDTCVAHVMANQPPAPCAKVDLRDHYALLKSRQGVAQFLLIPTDRISGIESPALLAAHAPPLWQSAWAGRGAVMALAPRRLGDNDIILAINPPWGRTQNQLHIHIDCVAPRITRQLDRVRIAPDWQAIRLDGVAFQVRRFDIRTSPFDLLARLASAQHTSMADWSMASIGPDILLATRAEPTEKLQDHQCAGE